MTDQIHVGVPYVTPSSRNGEMCRSSALAILRSWSCGHGIVCLVLISKRAGSGAILLVADLFHPVDVLAVVRFLNGDVRHRRARCCAMPMLQAWRKPHHITGPDFLDRPAFALDPAEASHDD